jgi:hypothetical protein
MTTAKQAADPRDLSVALPKTLRNLIEAYRVHLDGREVHIEFWEQRVLQTCKRIAEEQSK